MCIVLIWKDFIEKLTVQINKAICGGWKWGELKMGRTSKLVGWILFYWTKYFHKNFYEIHMSMYICVCTCIYDGHTGEEASLESRLKFQASERPCLTEKVEGTWGSTEDSVLWYSHVVYHGRTQTHVIPYIHKYKCIYKIKKINVCIVSLSCLGICQLDKI